MTDFVKVKGTLKWARLNAPDEYDGEKFWRVALYPDADSLPIVQELMKQGIKNVLKKDDDGYFMNFRRPCQLLRKGSLKPLDPPRVTGVPEGQFIGNGSKGTVVLEVYGFSTRKGKAARLFAVDVEQFVPYDNTPKVDAITSYY
jgi:hypothetical protein